MCRRKRKSLERALYEYIQAKYAPVYSANLLALFLEPVVAKEYKCNCETNENVITCSFFNGQKFIITIEEIKEDTKEETE